MIIYMAMAAIAAVVTSEGKIKWIKNFLAYLIFPKVMVLALFWDSVRGWRGTSRKCGVDLIPVIGNLELEFVGAIPREPREDEESRKITQEECRLIKRSLELAWVRNALVALAFVALLAWAVEKQAVGIAVVVIVGIGLLGSEAREETHQEEPVLAAEGVYRIVERIFGFTIYRGAAYAKGGTIHSRLHVTGYRNLWLGDQEIKPSFVSEVADYVAWGSPPVVEPIREDDQVLVALLHPERDVVIPYLSVSSRIGNEAVYQLIKTSPGTSGSPVFVKRQTEDGDVYLFAGCAGRNIEKDLTHQYEVQTHLPVATVEYEPAVIRGSVMQIFSHPGAGKTRSTPEYVRQLLTTSDRVYLAGPTRVVANEMMEALRDMKNVGCMIKGKPRPEKGARVIVTTHQTLLRYLLTTRMLSERRVSYIIDETHFENTGSKVLLSMLRKRAEQYDYKGTVMEMTATGYNVAENKWEINSNSNYPIQDSTYAGSLEAAVRTHMANRPSDRIAVFVPSYEGKRANSAKNLARKLLDMPQRLVVLSRATYASQQAEIKRKTQRGLIIITTSISECGANYDLDAVFDTCRQYRYVVTDKGVVGQETPITQAQMVQRRGRVGRRREGWYYTPVSVHMEDLEPVDIPGTVVELETATVLREENLLDWEPSLVVRKEMEKIRLSKEQIANWLTRSDEGVYPMYEAWCDYTQEGTRRSPMDAMRKRRELQRITWDARMGARKTLEDEPHRQENEGDLWRLADEEQPEIYHDAAPYIREEPASRIRTGKKPLFYGRALHERLEVPLGRPELLMNQEDEQVLETPDQD